MTAAHRTQPLRRARALAPAVGLAAALLTSLALPQDPSPDSTTTWEIVAVDREGRPVPDVELELVDSMSSAASRPLGGARHVTDAQGRIAGGAGGAGGTGGTGGTGGADAPYVLDIVCPDAAWSVSFVHGLRIVDHELGDDLLGRPLLRIDTSHSVVCVLEPTGTIHVRVDGARDADRFHLCFVDDRPEPASHRLTRASTSFVGADGNLAAPVGRGTLYIAREGTLGAPILSNGRPLLVAVTAGRTSEVEVRFFDGPTTTLIAPFGAIPFKRLEALTPDGATVVADLPFESSPLRIPLALSFAVGTPHDPDQPVGFRLPKHLIRAADIPAPNALEPGGRDEPNPVRPSVDSAPVELVFPVDLGAKVRFPEVASGWATLAREGLMALGGAMSSGPLLDGARHAPGHVDLEALYRSLGRGDAESTPWSVVIRVFEGESTPAAHRELLISTRGLPPVRGVTDARGLLEVSAIHGDSITAAAFHAHADRIEVSRNPDSHRPFKVSLHLQTASRRVLGSWGPGEAKSPTTGTVLVLVPADKEEADARRACGTRAYPIAITDANGAFGFGQVPCGEYILRTGGGSELPVSVSADEPGDVVLAVSGTADSAALDVR